MQIINYLPDNELISMDIFLHAAWASAGLLQGFLKQSSTALEVFPPLPRVAEIRISFASAPYMSLCRTDFSVFAEPFV